MSLKVRIRWGKVTSGGSGGRKPPFRGVGMCSKPPLFGGGGVLPHFPIPYYTGTIWTFVEFMVLLHEFKGVAVYNREPQINPCWEAASRAFGR